MLFAQPTCLGFGFPTYMSQLGKPVVLVNVLFLVVVLVALLGALPVLMVVLAWLFGRLFLFGLVAHLIDRIFFPTSSVGRPGLQLCYSFLAGRCRDLVALCFGYSDTIVALPGHVVKQVQAESYVRNNAH